MDDAAVDAYIDFCQKALLPPEPRSERELRSLKQPSRAIRSLMTITANLVCRQRNPTQPNSDAAPSLLSEYFPLAPASSSSSVLNSAQLDMIYQGILLITITA